MNVGVCPLKMSKLPKEYLKKRVMQLHLLLISNVCSSSLVLRQCSSSSRSSFTAACVVMVVSKWTCADAADTGSADVITYVINCAPRSQR